VDASWRVEQFSERLIMKIRISSALILAATSVLLSGCVVAPIGRPVAAYPAGGYPAAAYPAGPVYYEPAPVVVVPSVRFGYYGGYGGGYGYRGYRHWR
jgi:hypothetical protein